MDPVNPYQAPAPGFGYELQYTDTSQFVLADVGTRLAGAIVDGLLFVVAVIPGAAVQIIVGDESDFSTIAVLLMAVCAVGIACVQWYLIATTGQSIAKRLLKMRIVRTNGAPVRFVHGVVLRSWVISALSNIPIVGGVIGLVALRRRGEAAPAFPAEAPASVPSERLGKPGGEPTR